MQVTKSDALQKTALLKYALLAAFLLWGEEVRYSLVQQFPLQHRGPWRDTAVFRDDTFPRNPSNLNLRFAGQIRQSSFNRHSMTHNKNITDLSCLSCFKIFFKCLKTIKYLINRGESWTLLRCVAAILKSPFAFCAKLLAEVPSLMLYMFKIKNKSSELNKWVS